MDRVYTAAEVRELDRLAIEEHGIAGIRLMKRAGRATFDWLRRCFPEARRLAVACGYGNNGGDGYIVAGLAAEAGFDVRILQLGDADRINGDAARARDWAKSLGPEAVPFRADALADVDVIVDALLGTGASGSVREPFDAAIDAINAAPAAVVAVDVPSGLCANTGSVLGTAVQADLTVTFIGCKLGLVTGAVDCVGRLELETLDVPEAVLCSAEGVEVLQDSLAAVPRRRRASHKNDFGHVLVIGGDLGMGGAVVLSGETALRAGCGLVSVITRAEHRTAVLARRPELMVRAYAEGDDITDLVERASVLAVGPGLGREPWGEQLLDIALQSGKPLVLDADALTLLASRQDVLRVPCVVTPHPGEAARLLGVSSRDVQADRPGAACNIAARYGVVAVLKGAGSLIAADGRLKAVCTRGNPAMATAGSGDVLTGLVAAAVALGDGPLDAARRAVFMHARAGDRAAADAPGPGLLAGDLAQYLWDPA